MASTTFIPQSPVNDDVTVINNGWYPDFLLSDLRAQMRITDEVENTVLEARLTEAMLGINTTLKDWKAVHVLNGIAGLAEVPSENYSSTTQHQILYKSAVFCRCKRLLIEQQRNLDTSSKGDDKASALDATAANLRVQENSAVRAMQGKKGAWAVTLL